MKRLSFRDPLSEVYINDNQIIRKLKQEEKVFFEDLFKKSFYEMMIKNKWIQKSEIKDKENLTEITHEKIDNFTEVTEMSSYQLFLSGIFWTLAFALFSFIYYLTLVIIFFSSIGSVVGFLAYQWDTQSTVSNFFISPINFLSGTFFSLEILPDNLKYILVFNPYYYIITYFRDSFYIKTEINYFINSLIFTFILIIFIISGYIFYKGYNVIK